MEALQKVFETMMGVINIIKEFFEQLFGKKEEETPEAPSEEA
ncbi:MAG: hypothetical protein ACI4GC_03005 [Acutalibacteraceae bacterium]